MRLRNVAAALIRENFGDIQTLAVIRESWAYTHSHHNQLSGLDCRTTPHLPAWLNGRPSRGIQTFIRHPHGGLDLLVMHLAKFYILEQHLHIVSPSKRIVSPFPHLWYYRPMFLSLIPSNALNLNCSASICSTSAGSVIVIVYAPAPFKPGNRPALASISV